MKFIAFIFYMFLAVHLLACSEGSFTSSNAKAPGHGGSDSGTGSDDGSGGDTAGGSDSGDRLGVGGGKSVIGFGSDADGGNASIVIGSSIKNNDKEFYLSLAVSSGNCIACHGKVAGNFVTDFNARLRPFSTRNEGDDLIIRDSFRYKGWSTLNLDGNLVVPKVVVDSPIINSRTGRSGLTIKETLTTPINYASTVDASDGIVKSINVIGEQRDKSKAGVNDIMEVGSVHIDPPTSEQIAQIAAGAANVKTLLEAGSTSVQSLNANSVFSGFALVNGDLGESVVMNTSGPLECEGDILIKGSLIFNEASTLKTTSGCRLYVTKSVFIRGKLELTGGELRNLQIAAGHDVVMGIKNERLVGKVLNRHHGPFLVEYNDLVNARAYLEDATFPGTTTRKSYQYERMLIASDSVHSRYFGKYKGIIISHFVLFALEHFNFEADPVFEKVRILPMLDKQVLVIK